MFVAHWEPGNLPEKPSLSSAPIWLELRNVPLQFFNEDCLERIAGLVGDPKYLHPTTANKTDLEVAKVLTIIDPRKPLPEAVNVQFDSGDICRVKVSSPWMPPVCSHCKEIGHSIKRCPSAPKTCVNCKSTTHSTESCTRARGQANKKGKRPRRPVSPSKQLPRDHRMTYTPPTSGTQGHLPALDKGKGIDYPAVPPVKTPAKVYRPKSTDHTDTAETSKAPDPVTASEVESDSSDIQTSESDAEEGQYIPVKTRHRAKKGRDRGPLIN